MIYFTSDTHFGHKNISSYCGRPWLDVNEHDEELIRRWNERVRPGDRVYHLGDFYMGPAYATKVPELRKRLNGEILLILGNHDRGAAAMIRYGFEGACTKLPYEHEGRRFFLRHAPGLGHDPGEVPDGFDFMLCGHVHNRWKVCGKQVNVGVDVWDYKPITMDEIMEVL